MPTGAGPSDVENSSGHKNHSGLSSFLLLLTFLASLGGILFGYDLGIISSALPGISTELGLSNYQQEWVVALLYLGGGFGAFVGGHLCDSRGRRTTILITDVAFVLGAIIVGSVRSSLFQILVGRTIIGFAVAVSGIADVSYLNEIAPAEYRGALVSVNEVCIALGFMLSFLAGILLTSDRWRTLFGLSGVVAVVQFIGIWFMPESPMWLKQQGRTEDALVANDLIQHSNQTSVMGQVMRQSENGLELSPPFYRSFESTSTQLNIHTAAPSTLPVPSCDWFQITKSFSDFLKVATSRQYRKQSAIAMFLSVAQQVCGHTSVLSYASTILATASGDSNSTIFGRWSTLWLGLVKLLVTCLVVLRVEKFGRRFFLLTGTTIIAFGLLLLVISFASSEPLEENQQDDTLLQDFLLLPGVVFVVMGYSISFGPLTWLVTAELFPAQIRGRALGCATIVTYTCAAMVTATFLSQMKLIGASLVFITYLIITLLSIGFVILAIPETREKSPKEIGQAFFEMPFWTCHTTAYKLTEVDGVRLPSTTSRYDTPHEEEVAAAVENDDFDSRARSIE